MADSRCTGECCKDFVVTRHNYRSLLDVALREAANALDEDDVPESVRVVAMIRPLVGESPSKANEGKWLTEAHRHFTCVHLKPNGDCGDYENRPRMCREYPYGNSCEHGANCTWEEARLVSIEKRAAAEGFERSKRYGVTASYDFLEEYEGPEK